MSDGTRRRQPVGFLIGVRLSERKGVALFLFAPTRDDGVILLQTDEAVAGGAAANREEKTFGSGEFEENNFTFSWQVKLAPCPWCIRGPHFKVGEIETALNCFWRHVILLHFFFKSTLMTSLLVFITCELCSLRLFLSTDLKRVAPHANTISAV